MIKLAHTKYGERVVVLVDEYDKPMRAASAPGQGARLIPSALNMFFVADFKHPQPPLTLVLAVRYLAPCG